MDRSAKSGCNGAYRSTTRYTNFRTSRDVVEDSLNTDARYGVASRPLEIMATTLFMPSKRSTSCVLSSFVLTCTSLSSRISRYFPDPEPPIAPFTACSASSPRSEKYAQARDDVNVDNDMDGMRSEGVYPMQGLGTLHLRRMTPHLSTPCRFKHQRAPLYLVSSQWLGAILVVVQAYKRILKPF